MSGDTRSRGKKAGGGAAKNSKSNNQAANRQYAAKKQSKERKKMMEKQKQGHSSSCFSSLTFWVLLALIGLSYGTYQTHPEKFKAVFDQLPLQVCMTSPGFRKSNSASYSLNKLKKLTRKL